ncbi:MAG TPA: hypothetical protein VNI52_08455 [Sphingobacteriaceae bacterium]|nr:hypothetical protein [Sphingobacteriaceae bacterium]
MDAKDLDMFYFDDRTFVTLCKQLEREIKNLHDFNDENAYDLRLIYKKFELFLAVYYKSKGRDDIDYKAESRKEIAAEINLAAFSVCDDQAEHSETPKENYKDAKEKLNRVLEDVIYQVAWKNPETQSM